MKRLFFLFALLFYSYAAAQTDVQLIISGTQSDPVMNPVFSPDGSKIAYTKAGYKGILIYDTATKSSRQIADEDAAGFALKWSADSKSILTRVAKYEGIRRFNAVKIFNIDSNDANQLTEYRTSMPYLPEWADGDSKVILPTRESFETYSSGKPKLLYKNNNEKNVLLKYDNIAVRNSEAGQTVLLQPVKNSDYISLSISPDRSKAVFKVVGGNLYVMSLDGTGLTVLGTGSQPGWSSDGNRIIYSITEDNGHDYTSSDIFIINSDGTGKRNLTNTADIIEMNPSISPDGRSVVYDVYNDGSIYSKSIE